MLSLFLNSGWRWRWGGSSRSGGRSGSWRRSRSRRGFRGQLADQAHFINDFKAFTGETPGSWDIDDASLTKLFAGRGFTVDM